MKKSDKIIVNSDTS